MNLYESSCRIVQKGMKVVLQALPMRVPNVSCTIHDLPTILNARYVQRPLIITDKEIRNSGILQYVCDVLNQDNIQYRIYDRTNTSPTIQNVEEASIMYIQNACDHVIALGRGSIMDCAKICLARVVQPQKSVEEMHGQLRIHTALPLLIAIPTTSGTGSEATSAAMILDESIHTSYVINDPALIPHVTILDPSLTISLSKQQTASSGMEALTHTLEALLGQNNTPITRKYGEKSLSFIKKSLLEAYDDGTSLAARDDMQKASFMAGIALTRANVGYVHALSHALEARYNITHGLANAILLPHVLETYGTCIHAQLAYFADLIQITKEHMGEAEKAYLFIRWIKDLNRHMQIPNYIEQLRVEDIPYLSAHAHKEANPLYPVPKIMRYEDFATIYFRILR